MFWDFANAFFFVSLMLALSVMAFFGILIGGWKACCIMGVFEWIEKKGAEMKNARANTEKEVL